jgi:hypothetical protein
MVLNKLSNVKKTNILKFAFFAYTPQIAFTVLILSVNAEMLKELFINLQNAPRLSEIG